MVHGNGGKSELANTHNSYYYLMLASEEFDPIRTQLRGPRAEFNLFDIWCVRVANDGGRKRRAACRRRPKTGATNRKINFARTICAENRQTMAHDMARILLTALGEAKLTGLAAAEERLNAHRYPPTV
jgi:hypothetical protein